MLILLLNFLPSFYFEEVDVLFSSLLGLLLAVEWFLLDEGERNEESASVVSIVIA